MADTTHTKHTRLEPVLLGKATEEVVIQPAPTRLEAAVAEQVELVLIQVVVVRFTPVEEDTVKEVIFLLQARVTPEEVVVEETFMVVVLRLVLKTVEVQEDKDLTIASQ